MGVLDEGVVVEDEEASWSWSWSWSKRGAGAGATDDRGIAVRAVAGVAGEVSERSKTTSRPPL